VLGAPSSPDGRPSPTQARRLERALEHWQSEPSAELLLLGGAVHNEAVESDTMRQWLLEKGVPADSIRTEERTASTRDQARLLCGLVRDHRPESLIVVSDRLHLPRVRMLLRRAGTDMGVVGLSGARLPGAGTVLAQACYEARCTVEDRVRTRLGRW